MESASAPSSSRQGRPDRGRPFSSPQRDFDGRPSLVARGLSVGYPTARGTGALTPALDLELRGGELICLLGPNGAGKSTLLRTLAGVQPALGGQVELDGRPIDEPSPRQRARKLAVVLTDGGPPLGMSGLELVRLGRQPHSPWSGKLRRRDHDAVARALDAVDGAELASRPLGQLSDGERQKLLLARALAQEAEILLLDEITAFLDVPRRLEIFRILRRLAHHEGKAVLLTTHDLDLALRSADRVWLISSEGLVTGAPESLVLDGSFSRAFAGRGIEFDRATGRFHLPMRRRGHVSLHGQGLPALWAAHGLERLGFVVERGREEEPGGGIATEGAYPLVEAGDHGFSLSVPGQPRRSFDRLDGVLDALVILFPSDRVRDSDGEEDGEEDVERGESSAR